ncbi:tyrosine-type recombinase/integrase [Fodinibius sediminis]|uniref:Site-specific recombinase XerD n=1 Tax=Fodinibius sediminis TaxID=1214077 RepID=A0A521AU40_9BACT|nr:site-specific integrase [Fodinibius sediminis]SMO38324.1 Site-specific recombinase XerD [Fodinibius sediminis]
MPKKRLNEQFLRNLKPQEKRVEYYDQHFIKDGQLKKKGVKGFLVRLTKAGNKYFYYNYWFDGKAKKYKIGSYPDIGVSKAREIARELSFQVDRGIDPQAEKKKRKQVPDTKTFKEISEEFKEKYLPTLKKKTRDEYSRIIDVELVPKLGKYPIKEISRNQIINLLDSKAFGKKPAPVMANRIRARLSKIYSFAINRGLAEDNPVSNVSKYKKTKAGGDVEKKRSRWYKPKEIQELWKYFDNWNEPTGSVLKMLLITGQRKTETMHMKWDDIREGIWTIPADLAKNGEEHLVPLSDMAIQIIEELRPTTGNSDYVFCSPKEDNAPMKWLTRARVTIQEESDVPDFRPHDLRRTVATYMTKLGVTRTVLGKILNHKGLAKDDLVTAIYDRHGYMDERRQALDRWSYRLQSIIDDDEKEKIAGKIG